jgi:2-polyprenyl-3-methyl-5-hydroxy-6-metoxy-1,4-benzoquinol methylase
LAHANASEQGINKELFEVRSIYDLDPGHDSAELVVCCEVLEHLEHPEEGLLALQSITTKNLIVSVPREPIWRFLNMVRGKYISDWGNTPGHLQHWSKRGFMRLVSKYFLIEVIKTPLPWTMLLCSKRD